MALPLVFYMLHKFCVPRRMDFVAVYPIDNEFSKYRIGKVLRYARQLKCLVDSDIGCPIGLKAFREGTVMKAVLVSSPALPRKLNKFTVDLFWCAASLLPIQDELGSNRFNELRRHFSTGQNLFRIETRLPCIVKSCRFFNRKGRMLLLLAPVRQYMMAKARIQAFAVARCFKGFKLLEDVVPGETVI